MEITIVPKEPLKQLTWQDVITAYAQITATGIDLLDSNSEILYRTFLTVEEFENHLAEIFDCVLLGFSKQNQEIYAKSSTLLLVKYKHGADKSIMAQRSKIREKANRIIYSIKYNLFPSAMAKDIERRQMKKRKLIEAKESDEEDKATESKEVVSATQAPDPEIIVMTKRDFDNKNVQDYMDVTDSDVTEESASGVSEESASGVSEESASGVSTELSSLSIGDKHTFKGRRSGGHGQKDENGLPLRDLYETPNELVDSIVNFISTQLGPLGILPTNFFDPAVGE
jgi:hypothetical protein